MTVVNGSVDIDHRWRIVHRGAIDSRTEVAMNAFYDYRHSYEKDSALNYFHEIKHGRITGIRKTSQQTSSKDGRGWLLPAKQRQINPRWHRLLQPAGTADRRSYVQYLPADLHLRG